MVHNGVRSVRSERKIMEDTRDLQCLPRSPGPGCEGRDLSIQADVSDRYGGRRCEYRVLDRAVHAGARERGSRLLVYQYGPHFKVLYDPAGDVTQCSWQLSLTVGIRRLPDQITNDLFPLWSR